MLKVYTSSKDFPTITALKTLGWDSVLTLNTRRQLFGRPPTLDRQTHKPPGQLKTLFYHTNPVYSSQQGSVRVACVLPICGLCYAYIYVVRRTSDPGVVVVARARISARYQIVGFGSLRLHGGPSDRMQAMNPHSRTQNQECGGSSATWACTRFRCIG